MHCLPASQSISPSLQANTDENITNTVVGDEFSGLTLLSNKYEDTNKFSIENLGLFAVAAMKEEALLDYDEPLVDLDFMDYIHPQPPLRFSMKAETQSILDVNVKRSTILWTINTLVADLMRTRYLHRLTFDVKSFSELIYRGLLNLEGDRAIDQPPPKNLSEVAKKLSNPLYLAVKPINATTFSLHSYSKLHDHPIYTIDFVFVPGGTELSAYQILRAYLAMLLQLAKADSSVELPQVAMTQSGLQAWMFMTESRRWPANHTFRQFQAVAMVEAMARYMQLHGKYREMTFRLHADGQLLAEGCVVKAVQYRRWCHRLLTGYGAGTADVSSS
ncbi:MAG: hypothetical protein Q9216_001993 [Gyalolechia sp. 2 TL-2023]